MRNEHTSRRDTSQQRQPEPIRPEQVPLLFRWLHWVLPLSALVLIASGVSLHAVARPEWSLTGGTLPGWAWSGRVNLWHLAAALVFAPCVLAMLWICRRGGFWGRPPLLVLLVGGALSFASGVVLQDAGGSYPLYTAAHWIHAGLGLALIPLALGWHTVTGLLRPWPELVATFHPWARGRLMPVLGLLVLAVVTSGLILSGFPAHLPWRTLVAPRIDRPDAAGGTLDLAGLPWGRAEPLTLHLTGGSGFHGGQTRVTLQALHDGTELYVRAAWLDPKEDRRYLPWKKTADGWRHLASGPSGGPMFDERVYYEDKFALIFPTGPDPVFDQFGCAAQCHAGGGRAYGYKGSDVLTDVWHWKATRTDPLGQADDKHWSEVDFDAKDVGRHGDPKRAGGYEKNIAEEGDHPAYLPKEMSAIRQGIIPREHAVGYNAQRAAGIAVGAVIPGIVASPAEGDRGDIACRSHHDKRSGSWVLYMRRKLDTGSANDAVFRPGEARPFACAAFESCSKRHAYNLRNYRLLLAP